MNIKGTLSIIILSFISIGLWLAAKLSPDAFQVNTWRMLAQLAGVIAATLFSFEFILASRLRIIDKFFGGLDKVYKLHHLVGGLAFIVLLYHPIFLVMSSMPYTNVAINYLIPTKTLSYSLGVLAFYSLIALLFITFYVKLPYHWWKRTHIFMGVPLVLASAHVAIIVSDTTDFLPLKLWLMGLLSLATVLYIYRRFLYQFIGPKYTYQISRIEDRGLIRDIYLTPRNRSLQFTAGQFIYVKFHSTNVDSEKHPFTISAGPDEPFLRLSIKELGDYTKTLSALKQGDEVSVFGPYGAFGEKSIVRNNNQIWVAGGIGITPFLSLLHYHVTNQTGTPITFFYCVKNEQEAAYLQDIQLLVANSNNIRIIPWYSETQGYMNAQKLQEYCSELASSNIFLCGPKPMMTGLTEQLIKQGVKGRNVIFEDFSLI